MSDRTGIAWCTATWNPFRGCSRMVDSIGGTKESDPLCRWCYAARIAAHPWWGGPGKAYEGLAILNNKEPLWTGRVFFAEDQVSIPLGWRKPRRIFLNSMSDTFHEQMPFDLIDEVMYTMQRAHWHTFLVLTKRVGRALEYMKSSPARWQLVQRLKHVQWGASVGTQRHADLRIPIMLQWPVAQRWLSMEPLLEPVSLRRWLSHEFSANPRTGFCEDCKWPKSDRIHVPSPRLDLGFAPPPIQWIVVGGESGPKNRIRPSEHHWYRFVRNQAQFAGAAFFQKQLSELDGKGFADVANFPEDLRIQEYPQ